MSDTFYSSYASYLRRQFGGKKTYKVVVAGGFTCPTRDGTLDSQGCAFCDVRGSSSFFGKHGRGGSIQSQIQNRLPAIRQRFGSQAFLAYFQSYTNTYADIAVLKESYEAALEASPEIAGLCIGTRPDCLADPVLDLLETLTQRKPIFLELGIQSLEDETLQWLKRGHTAACSLDTLQRLQERAPHVQVCGHLLFGSPTDSPDVARKTALCLNQTHLAGVKLHQLMVLQHTELAKRWQENPFPTLSLEAYGETLIAFLEALDPRIYIERLYATATHPEECLAPSWSRERWRPHNFFQNLFKERGLVQGGHRS